MMKASPWIVYIIETERGHLYTGITTNLDRRFKEHSSSTKGAKYFRSNMPLDVVFTRGFANRSEASSFEAQIKKMKRADKIKLVSGGKKA